MNKIMLIGRMASDKFINQTQSGIKNAKFILAVDRTFGEKESDFVPIITWRQQAEFVENYVDKGDLISIEGSFQSSKYINQAQEEVTKYEVSAHRINTLESRQAKELRKKGSQAGYAKVPSSPNALKTDSTQALNQVGSVPKQVTQEASQQQPQKPDAVPWDLDV